MFYFHIEGMDLAGKTTASKAISANFGNCLIRRNTLQDKSCFHSIVDQIRIDGTLSELDTGLLYCKVLEDDLRHFQNPTQDTIQDSTVLLRSLSYHYSCGNWDLVREFENLLHLHPRFTKTVVLTASLESRLTRLEMRKLSIPEEVAADDLMILTDPDKFFLMEKYLVNYAVDYFDATVLDTSRLTTKEVELSMIEIFR